MPHVILLGDSIFDNAAYVPDRPPLIEQLRQALPTGWNATLLAVDGHVTSDVPDQLRNLPADATHLIVSVGGNDALQAHSILQRGGEPAEHTLGLLQEAYEEFSRDYGAMIAALQATQLPAVLCTIYDRVPDLSVAERATLAGFNEAILRAAFAARLCVIDLRLLCDQPDDYSHVLSIEPSATAGLKISRVIAHVVTTHDFRQQRSVIY